MIRFSTQLDPDPCWPLAAAVVTAYVLLVNCSTAKLSCRYVCVCVRLRTYVCACVTQCFLSFSKLLPLTSYLPLPLTVAMVIFSPLHLYRVTYFLSAALVPLALCCLL